MPAPGPLHPLELKTTPAIVAGRIREGILDALRSGSLTTVDRLVSEHMEVSAKRLSVPIEPHPTTRKG